MAEVMAALLSGGSSTRMGADKALVELEGRPLSEWVRSALDGLPVVAVGAPLEDLPLVEDAPGEGPLAGLAAALRLDATSVFVTAVDQPWLRRETVAGLVDRHAGTITAPVSDGVRQVTCAVYPTALAQTAADLAASGASIQALLDAGPVDEVTPDAWAEWGEDGRSWFSVDTPDDLATGLLRYGSPDRS